MIWLPQTMSTNLYLKENVTPHVHGTVCCTMNQTAGRGRLGRVWDDGGGGNTLAMSILLQPRTAPEKLSALPAVFGMAAAAALGALTGAPLKIKWPNDIICGQLKICGLLCEIYSPPSCDRAVIIAGIGINLYRTRQDFDRAGLPGAASLSMVSEWRGTPEQAATAVYGTFMPMYKTLEQEGFAPFRGGYAGLCDTLGREVCVTAVGGKLLAEGLAEDIDGHGRLIVRTDTGTFTADGGEVSIRGQ